MTARSILPAFLFLLCACNSTDRNYLNVDASEPIHHMKGGLGASWHAISRELELNNPAYEIKVREENPRGSGYGGNPPVTRAGIWEQIEYHASWLGLDFVRVELSQRMYEPERGRFDWDNEEMQALYRILEWAEANEVDVFLQQMWTGVEWNALPGIHPLISAPKDLDDYAHGIASLLKYLTGDKGYNCIRYFGMTNEPPGGTWGYWWETGGTDHTVEAAWKRVYDEFKEQGIRVPISGPGWTDMPPFDPEKLEMARYFGALDIHSYQGVDSKGEDNLRKWAAWAHEQQKPFFLTEFGNMQLGWGGSDPHPKSFDAAISNACDVLRGMRAGVDGFNRWSFTNRGDLDGQWQLVRTWDPGKQEYLDRVLPEPEAYYGFAALSRFLVNYSSTVRTECNLPDSVMMYGAVRSPDGDISLFLVNQTETEVHLELSLEHSEAEYLYLYQVSDRLVNQPDFAFSPEILKVKKHIHLVLLPRSINTLTSIHAET